MRDNELIAALESIAEWAADCGWHNHVTTARQAATRLRDLTQAGGEIEPSEEAVTGRDKQGHRTRMSDSSLYDEVCMYCGARDYIGNDTLRLKCTATESKKAEVDKRLDSPRFASAPAHDAYRAGMMRAVEIAKREAGTTYEAPGIADASTMRWINAGYQHAVKNIAAAIEAEAKETQG